MKVYVWRSFSSNNSSDFRLVARFTSVARIKEVRAELETFMAAHAEEVDGIEDGIEDLSETQRALAKKYKFKWPADILGWGDEGLSGNEPQLGCTDDTLVMYHDYCGGLDHFTPYLEARGAEVDDDEGLPEIGVQITLPRGKAGQKMRAELEAFFAQAETGASMDEWKKPPPWGPSYFRWADADSALFYCDGEHVVFQVPMGAGDLDALEKYTRRAQSSRLVICEPAFTRRLKTLNAADRCPECFAPGLRLLPAEGEQLDQDQLLCSGCGGMFTLAAVEGLQQADAKVERWLSARSVSRRCGSCGGGELMVKTIGSRVDGARLRCLRCGATTTPRAILGSSPVTKVGKQTIGGVAGLGDSVLLAQEDKTIYRSKGGKAFKAVHKADRGFNQVFVSSKGKVFASGYGEVLRSDDGGERWTSVPCKPPLYLFQFSETPAGTIFVPTMGYVFRSKNGGKSFTRTKLPSNRDTYQVVVASEKTLFIVGNGGTLLGSNDGGKTWNKRKAPVTTALHRGLTLGEKELVLVGSNGVVLTTANGGKTWTKRRTGTRADIEDLTLGNDGQIYAVTGEGEVLISNNGGKKWRIEPSGTREHLYAICARADGTLFMTGANGVVVQRDDLDCPADPAQRVQAKTATKKTATKKTATKKTATKKTATVGQTFLFTGKLASMSRAAAKKQATNLGGITKSSVSRDLDYLVVGDEGSPLFGGGKKGSKLVAAEKLIAQGRSLQIISETDFLKMKRAPK